MSFDVSSANGYEATSPEINDFAESSLMLIGSLQSLRRDDVPTYFRTEWDINNPQRLEHATAANLEPTGARREVRGSTFGQAQFVFSETDILTGKAEKRFNWCYTGFLPLGVELSPDLSALENDFGYQPLEADNVLDVLSNQAESLGDFTALLKVLGRTGLDAELPVTRKLSSMLYDRLEHTIRGDFSALSGADSGARETMTQEVIQLIGAADIAGNETGKSLRSRMISRMGQIFDTRWGLYGEANPYLEVQLSAAELAKTLIDRGTIAPNTPSMKRLLGQTAIFRHPFATEIALAELETSKLKPTTKMVFNKYRHVFAHSYVMYYLDGKMREVKQDSPLTTNIKQRLSTTPNYPFARSRTAVNFGPLFDMAGDIDVAKNGSKPSDWHNDHAEKNVEPDAIAEAFSYVLQRLLPAEPVRAAKQEQVDSQAVRLLELVLNKDQLILSRLPTKQGQEEMD
ncbi:MAG TPA: hypothetical protein VG604_03095 [Candidatus Saccharimonadales bacterium]|nr:hypothetical protein [Candidatus Saccharimonadales bacterium]